MKKGISVQKTIFYALLGFVAILMGCLADDRNRLAVGFVQILSAVILYFVMVARVAEKNWMDIRAVFTAAWIGTIGLATLRLTEYQERWQTLTWILLAAGYLLFQIGAAAGIGFGKKLFVKAGETINRISPVKFSLHSGRLYYICVITTLIGFSCFVANVMIRGYIPCFASDGNSYTHFYTKFYLFAVAATMISGLCYYCIKTQNCTFFQKVVLLVCIVYSTVLFPLLVVSRGTMLTSALSLATVVFYLHRRKLLPLVLCAVMVVGLYMGASTLRGYTDEQLKYIFEPATIVQPTEPEMTEPEMTEPEMTEPEMTEPEMTEPEVTEPEVTEPTTIPPTQNTGFTLPPKLAFVYSYLTVGHDNFNEAVQNTVGYTYGVRQLEPFNVILRIDAIDQMLVGVEYYVVRGHLNVTNMLGDTYYDFHSAGVLMMLLWAFIFGAIQGCVEKSKGPFALLALGNAMTPIVLGSFESWMSVFSHWMHWGVVLIFCIIACVDFKKRQ